MQITYRRIWHITYPILLSLFVEQIIGITDTAFLGHLGEVELGASALAGVCYLIFYVIGSGFGIGMQILIGRLNGEKNRQGIYRVFFTGTFFLLSFSCLLIILSRLFLPGILYGFIHSVSIYNEVLVYLNWRIYGLIFSFLIVAFRAYYIGITTTKILAVSSSVMVICNIICNYILIFGKWGMPYMGIGGAALGSTIAEGISALVLIVYTYGRDSEIVNLKRIKIRRHCLKRILRLSIWTMLQSFLSIVSWFIFFLVIEHIGGEALAVSNIIRSISAIPFLTILAFASTESSLVSNLLGENQSNSIWALYKKVVILCYIICMVVVCLGFAMPTLILKIYTGDPDLIRMGVYPLYVLLSSYFIAVPAYMLYYIISGTGNTFSSLLVGILSLIIYMTYIGIIGSYHPDILWLWASEHVYAICIAIFSAIYLFRFNWRRKKI